MAAVKSILDIDINDENFRRYKELFDKYHKQVSQMPNLWANVNKETRATLGTVAAVTLAQNQIARELSKNQRGASLDAKVTDASWKSIATSSGKFAKNILSATKDLLKWTGITAAFGGLLGAGGLFGIDRLASVVNAGRRTSLGLGASYGATKAFNLNYGRVVDSGFLSSVNEALHDQTRRYSFMAAGLSERDLRGSTADVGVRLLDRVKRLVDTNPNFSGPGSAQMLQATGLGNFFTVEDLNRIKALSPAEFARYRASYQSDKNGLGLGGDVQAKWQNLSVQLGRAGQQIENILVRGLTPLAGPIGQLSDSVSKAIQAFLGSDTLKQWMPKLGAGIEELGHYLGSDSFKDDVLTIAHDIGILAHSIHRAIGWISGTPANPGTAPAPIPFHGGHLDEWYWYNHSKKKTPTEYPWWMGGPSHNPGNLVDSSGIGFAHFSSDREGLLALRTQLLKDETLHGQTTLRQLIYGNSKWPGYTTTDREAYLRNLVRTVQLAPDAQLDPTNSTQLARLMAGITKQEGRTPYTPQAIVEIFNNTGGNAIVQTSQVAR